MSYVSLPRYVILLVLLAVSLLLPSRATYAATYTVSNLSDLRSRIANAAPGDTIIMVNGTYNNSAGPIVIDRQGTASQPITITAQTIGGVTIGGSSGFTFSGAAAYIVLRGFRFTHTAGTIELPAGSHHCRILRNEIRLAVSGRANFVTVVGDDHEIAYNTFREKRTEGVMLGVEEPSEGSTAIAQRTWIHHNYFLNFYPSGLNNSGALQIGHSWSSLISSHALVEHNLFVNTRGENEGSITSKTSDATYRYNTIGASAEELSLRHGNRVQVYGNFFVGSIGGLRIFGDDHRIYNNYFESNQKAIHVGNGDCTIPPGALVCHDRPDNVHVTFNTLVNNSRNIFMDSRSNGRGATGLVVANNIVQGGPEAVDFNGPVTGATWQGNIIWNTSAGNMQGHTTLNPRLVEDGNSEYHLSSSSPAIDRAAGTYSYVTADMDLHARNGTKDTGADEYSTAAVANRILTASDVGPNADLSGTPTPTPTATGTLTPTPTATSTPTLPPGNDGAPFGGTPWAVPGTIQAENYNTGGQAVAYNDTDATNNGGAYRASEGVDIQATTDTGGGFNVGWTRATEWLKYTVNVQSSGSYTFNARVAAAAAGASFHAEIDGVNVTGPLSVPNTGGNQVWQTISKSGINLTAGQHVLRVVFDTPVTGGTSAGNYNFFSFSAANPSTTVEAESCTLSQAVVATNHTGFSGTGFVDYNNVTGSFVECAVSRAAAGSATLSLRYANGSTANRPMSIAVNGTVVNSNLAFNPTANWDTWATQTLTINLLAGSNTIRMTSTTADGGPNLDRIAVQ